MKPGAEGRPIVLADRAAIEAALGRDGDAPSEHCFANLYLFRDRHGYRLRDDPIPHIVGMTYDDVVHALPLASLTREEAVRLFETGIGCLYPMGPAAPELADRLGLRLAHVDADSDYIYDGPAMASLAGAKVRRAQARAFEQEEAPLFFPWTDGLADEARTVLQGWLADVGRKAADTDVAECEEAIAQAAALGLEGALVRTASGEAAAFLLASARQDTRVIHFAKGRRHHSAAYPWLFSRYAAATGARLLNFEQDLGNPGLAQSKRAYAPIERRPKYRLLRS